MKEIPCKDCLIFPMCRSRCTVTVRSIKHINYLAMIGGCNLFSEWFKNIGDKGLIKVEKLFGVVSWLDK